jgi:lipoprotein-releasing system ATP-binding protein
MSSILEAQHISHQFQEKGAQAQGQNFSVDQILKDVSLSVFSAEILGIIGTSGAGKSTLLKILSGLLTATKGEVYFEGKPLHKMNEKEKSHFRNQKMGFIDQFHRLLPELSVAENVALPYWIQQQKKIAIPLRVYSILESVGIADKARFFPYQLSGGQQQRVAIARALMNQPSIIFADEPSGNLDTENAGQIYALFEVLRKEAQVTFVIVTHNEDWKNKMDRKIHLKDGKIWD